MPLVSLRAELKKAGSSPQNENLYQPEIFVFHPFGIIQADFFFIFGGFVNSAGMSHPFCIRQNHIIFLGFRLFKILMLVLKNLFALFGRTRQNLLKNLLQF